MERKINIYINKYKTSVYISLPASLTETECALLFQLLRGKSLSEIAEERHRSLKTVSCQKSKIYRKLGIRNDLTLWRDILLGFTYKTESVNDLTREITGTQFNWENENCYLSG
ncbi:helix-turn-helix transcriptional regulator [Escherichia coli]|uniref:helix-turn-helix domain-containing protein n=1 Tax=Escherichia coli TaxID=562 RepID=UPI000CFDD790|nr:helix-turn-helix transcriptional regulator [Escherichia coli]EFB1475398.1 helix-turn-helix transcriptional regulator [Escherichia coli]MJY49339.1 LuxR family transcriptional regulator [Escherichia coli]QLM28795.1 helix-turn-helix transcriptional regulator [Escherichia coli]QMB13718.1 helix-turn-helix transcriptional regulator [Escherichia coli]HCO7775056.1 helix-turn-helix transcriptional regulator [Escherichia coli]